MVYDAWYDVVRDGARACGVWSRADGCARAGVRACGAWVSCAGVRAIATRGVLETITSWNSCTSVACMYIGSMYGDEVVQNSLVWGLESN